MLGINKDPVTIKSIELAIIDRAFDEGWVVPEAPTTRTWKKVAVIGSGPAGLAAAAQLNRAGHSVTVFEKADRIGGLLRYGIPEFKMEKRVLDRRLELLEAEGVVFRPGVDVGVDVTAADLRRDFDAVVLAGGAGRPRDLTVPGRDLPGVHFAMEYLTQQNRRCQGDAVPEEDAITAEGKHVIIIGGGDTGADCLGTAHRQGAAVGDAARVAALASQCACRRQPVAAVAQRLPHLLGARGGWRARLRRGNHIILRRSGRVEALHGRQVTRVIKDGRPAFEAVPDSAFVMKADLVLLAMGFLGPDKNRLLADLGVTFTDRGTVVRDEQWMTSVPGVFAAGDLQRGQSLIVWAIDDGRRAAASVDRFLLNM